MDRRSPAPQPMVSPALAQHRSQSSPRTVTVSSLAQNKTRASSSSTASTAQRGTAATSSKPIRMPRTPTKLPEPSTISLASEPIRSHQDSRPHSAHRRRCISASTAGEPTNQTSPCPINMPRAPPGNPSILPPIHFFPEPLYLSHSSAYCRRRRGRIRRWKPPQTPARGRGGAPRRVGHLGASTHQEELGARGISPFPFTRVRRKMVNRRRLWRSSTPSTTPACSW